MATKRVTASPPALSLVHHNSVQKPLTAAQEIRQLKLLAEASMRIHSTLDTKLVLRYLVDAAVDLVDADKGGAGLIAGSRIEFHVGKINGEWQEIALSFAKGVGVAGYTWEHHKPYVANDLTRDIIASRALSERLGSYNAVAVPVLSADSRYLGCFEIHNKRHQQPFTQRDVSLLEHLAVYAAVALDNARLFSEQKAAKELVQRSAECYQELFHNNMAIKLIIEPASGHIVDANEAAHRFYGFDTLSAMTLGDLEAEPSLLSDCGSLPRDVLAGDKHVQALHRCANGETKSTHIGISPVTVDGQDLLFAVVNDVTTRLAVETALADSEHITEVILENIYEGVCLSDKNGVLKFQNPATEKILGYRPDSLIGFNAMDILHIESHSQECPGSRAKKQLIEAALRGETLRCDNACFTHANGEPVPVEFLSAPILDSKGEVTGFVTSFMDISDRLSAERDFRELAYTDILTGLPNRLALQEKLDQQLAKSRKNRSSGAMLFCDVDNFKTINDSLGHAVGDEMLKEMAARARECAATSDLVARHGGDEFVLISGRLSSSPKEAKQRAKLLADKLQAKLAEPYEIDGQILHGSISIGIALFSGESELAAGDIMRHADTAMYEAKRHGRACTRLFRPAMQQAVSSRLQVEGELRRALQCDELEVHYQPKVDVINQNLCGAEALIRWRHPERGLVMPGDFIPTAEDSGLMPVMGQAILSIVFDQLAEWRDAGLQPVPVAINLSASEFNQPMFAEDLSAKLEEHDLPGGLIELEITETTLMEDPENVRMSMLALRQLGVRISVDDFGTGYSSLNYLKKFPLDTIKIDRAFIGEIPMDPDDRAITSAIVSMAKALELKTVAEGVETEAQLGYLQGLGCDQFQGWLHSKAMPAKTFSRLLEPQLTLVG